MIEVRETTFDVAVLAAPRIPHWPSVGVRAISKVCADAGLRVGVFGGPFVRVKGALPLPNSGGIVFIQDIQGRIHRIEARAVVRVEPWLKLPDPFPGWASEGCLPLDVASRLYEKGEMSWFPSVAILGTGNKALKFASKLLEQRRTQEVFVLETRPDWGGKRYAGWEVERRKFEGLGGKILEGTPISLIRKSSLIWEFRVEDLHGIRILQVSRVVSAGPFEDTPGAREDPVGSLLFLLEQTAEKIVTLDEEGWRMEEERGRWVGSRIARSLAEDLAKDKKTPLDRAYRSARSSLKFFDRHRQEPFVLDFEGKWIDSPTKETLRAFPGVPQGKEKRFQVASIECIEPIACDRCAVACPEKAIAVGAPPRKLTESLCTGCGICVDVCPSSVPVLIQDQENKPYGRLTLTSRGPTQWKEGETAVLINRRGEKLGASRVAKFEKGRVELEVPPHLLWEARGVRKKDQEAENEPFRYRDASPGGMEGYVEINLEGEKRLARESSTLVEHFFETGRARPGESLACPDGSCGLCAVTVDGVRKLACQEVIHRGMTILRPRARFFKGTVPSTDALCPCLGISETEVIERLKKGDLQSPESVRAVTHVGEGRCQGLLCRDAFRRLLVSRGMDAEDWLDWRFPWTEWKLPDS